MKVMNLKILKVHERDLPEILDLQKRAYQENALRYNDPKIAPLTQTLDELIEESKSYIILKAKDGEKIVGSVRGCKKEDYCYISRLFVHPDYQNRGIGRQLMASIEKEFDTLKFKLAAGHLDEKNISLYTKLGYKVCGKEKISDTFCFIHMEKKMNVLK